LDFIGLHEALVIVKMNCDQANYQCNIARKKRDRKSIERKKKEDSSFVIVKPKIEGYGVFLEL